MSNERSKFVGSGECSIRRDAVHMVRRHLYPDYTEIIVYYGQWVPKTCYSVDRGVPYTVDIACPYTIFRFDVKDEADAFYKDLIEVD